VVETLIEHRFPGCFVLADTEAIGGAHQWEMEKFGVALDLG
jgi:hypothetical protein